MKDIENVTRLLSMHAAGQETVTISADMAREITQSITAMNKDNAELRGLLEKAKENGAALVAGVADTAYKSGYECAQRDIRKALGLEVAVAPSSVDG